MIDAGLLVSRRRHSGAIRSLPRSSHVPDRRFRGGSVGFGGRALATDAPAKYLNSPETPLFHKGSLTLQRRQCADRRPRRRQSAPPGDGHRGRGLCGRHRAGRRWASRPRSRRSAPRSPPTSCVLLWQMADEPILCFDGDGAGRRAAYRAVDLALPQLMPGKSLSSQCSPTARIQTISFGRAAGRRWPRCSSAARPLSQMLWMRETEGGGLDTPERRAAFEARLGEVLHGIGDETVRKYYRRGIRRPPAAIVRGRHGAAVSTQSAR